MQAIYRDSIEYTNLFHEHKMFSHRIGGLMVTFSDLVTWGVSAMKCFEKAPNIETYTLCQGIQEEQKFIVKDFELSLEQQGIEILEDEDLEMEFDDI